jgi:hypothetical protein
MLWTLISANPFAAFEVLFFKWWLKLLIIQRNFTLKLSLLVYAFLRRIIYPYIISLFWFSWFLWANAFKSCIDFTEWICSSQLFAEVFLRA